MKVKAFIKWLEKQNQDLEICVIECGTQIETGAFGEEEVLFTGSVCFDDPELQSRKTDLSLILGIE